MGFAYGYKTLSSANARDFMQKLEKVFPYEIKIIENVIYFYNCPKHPKSNCFVERFNRTLEELFIFSNEEKLPELNQFNSNPLSAFLS